VTSVVAALAVALPAPAADAAASVVRVTGSQGNWQLQVDGAPYQVKGLTWGPPVADAGRYLPDLAAMGVNTVRTWGTDGSTRPLLDAAAANGIKVINGFWLQPGGGPGSGGCVNYVTDANYKNTMRAEIVRWVNTYRDHSGVLMWNVGNESVLGLQNCFGGDELERQRNAYTAFVNEVAVDIHAADPDHPVTSTDAWTGAWPYYRRNAPALDLYAVNSYGDVCNIQRTWTEGGYTKPYILTEAGPPGEWEVPDDENGVPAEPTDVAKRDGYTNAWRCITAHRGVALGATLFHYGLEYDFGGIWFNLVPSGLRRLSYHSVKKAYSGQDSANTPPVISAMSVGDSRNVPAGGEFSVHADVTDPDGDPITYQVLVNGNYVNGSKQLTPATFTRSGGDFRVTAPRQLGVWKVYVRAEDGRGNVGFETRSFRVVAPTPPGTNVARGRPATASSYQTQGDGAPFPPANATDGRMDTRWASDWTDPQWLQVDLGQVTTFRHVQLAWESAYGSAYQVRTSPDGGSWTTVYATTAGAGGVDTLAVTGTGRYVRLELTQRGTSYGYSLYEFGVYS
jgi:hypothetical protein